VQIYFLGNADVRSEYLIKVLAEAAFPATLVQWRSYVISYTTGEMNRIDWVPVDLLAGILVEFAAKEEVDRGEDGIRVFRPVHPHPTTWSTVRPWVISALKCYTEKELKVVSSNEWVDLVIKVSL
jgi:hypothetical protein